MRLVIFQVVCCLCSQPVCLRSASYCLALATGFSPIAGDHRLASPEIWHKTSWVHRRHHCRRRHCFRFICCFFVALVLMTKSNKLTEECTTQNKCHGSASSSGSTTSTRTSMVNCLRKLVELLLRLDAAVAVRECANKSMHDHCSAGKIQENAVHLHR